MQLKFIRNQCLAHRKILLEAFALFFFSGIAYLGLANLPTGDEPVFVTIRSGMTTREIGDLLYRDGIINNVYLFRILAQMEGLQKSLQAGEYSFTPDMTLRHVVDVLAKGDTDYIQFTIPEGYTIDQIAKLIEEKKLGSGTEFKALAKNFTPYDYMRPGAGVIYASEGFVFPDTYKVSRNIKEKDLLQMMVTHFDKQFTPAMRKQAQKLGLSIREVIILASIVEKEAKIERDRPIIASVFLNRLKKGMPLQSDATIQYILGNLKPDLTIEDTKISSPYNAYQHAGLPPGPIANPGLASIKAVLQPAKTDYLYFVADKQGMNHFSKTYEEHMALVEKVRS
ncbi:Hypothetical protein LUCI_1231 [Lucifera butyrica]|uniref:Endolytic murein transglycosylase n=1 Tax=Lucifera butyrica TaxID=1351585 RepID=A0A498R5C2_9FIRM|nr:endolytic transglycosylase MltG [Lucifera butyrica]VBB06020.1 Hypothetical protein LUCI_1231 [Lucifera butyrica]